MSGPLRGVKVVELQGRGPGPFGAMVLADLGADVVRINRIEDVAPLDGASDTDKMLRGRRDIDLLARGRRSIAVDLKHPDGLATALRLIDDADVLVEGYRPGVTERLGLGPDVCCARNPRLVYARITGWGQSGPYAAAPGHDVNYVALAGALDPLKRPGSPPYPPLNYVGDFGGGGMLLAVGILAALLERATSGLGQVVDTAMVDGVALLTALFHGMRAEGLWSDEPLTHPLECAAPFYNVYETADGRYVSVGAGEAQFYAELLERIGAPAELAAVQNDPTTWPAAIEQLAAIFAGRTFAEWNELLEGTNTCYAPVLTMEEATTHPHNVARHTFVDVGGVVQPAAAPRFSRTVPETGALPPPPGRDTTTVLRERGFDAAEIDALLAGGAVGQAG